MSDNEIMKRTKIDIRLTPELRQRAERICDLEGDCLSAFARRALVQYVREAEERNGIEFKEVDAEPVSLPS
jgi:predicted DNA-binding protein